MCAEMTVASKTGKVCLHCGKPLQTIGRQRKNGVQRHGDWDARVLHKKCWQQLHGRKHTNRSAYSGSRGGRWRKGWRKPSNYI